MPTRSGLTPPPTPRTLAPRVIREAVKAEMRRRKWSVRRLSIESGVTLSGVQTFLAPKAGQRAGGLTTDNVERVLLALGLRVYPENPKRPPPPAKPTRRRPRKDADR